MYQPARVAAVAAVLFIDSAVAQWPSGGLAAPQLPAAARMPAIGPPLYLAPPAWQSDSAAASPASPASEAPAAAIVCAADPDLEAARAFASHRTSGADLKTAVGRVLDELSWHEDLGKARAAAAAAARPVLWIQALGELDGLC